MPTARQTISRLLLTVGALASLSALVRAQGRTEVTINDTGVQAENLTSSQDGAVYFGSTAKGTIYRAAPGASQAEPWILASAAGLTAQTMVITRGGSRPVRPGPETNFTGEVRVEMLFEALAPSH